MWSSLSKSGSISRLFPAQFLIGKQQRATLWSLSQPFYFSSLSFFTVSEAASASKDTQVLPLFKHPQPLFLLGIRPAIDYFRGGHQVLSRSGISTRSQNMSSRPLTSEDKGSMGATASRSISTDSTDALADISFRIADQSRYEEILQLLYTNFHSDEPMSKAVQMIDREGTRNKVLDDFALQGLVQIRNLLGHPVLLKINPKQNLSIMAIDPVTDNLLGVSINVEAKKESKEKSLAETLEEYDDPRFKHIMRVLYYVNAKAGNIFEEMETDVVFDIKMVTTDKNQRRGGLATDLLRRSVELARNLGFKAVKTEATGLYSRRAFERLGFTVNAEYLYEDYVSPDGEKVFASLANHHRCTTLMSKRLFPASRLHHPSTIKEVK